MCGLGKLGEHDARDAGRDEHPDDALDAHDKDGPGTPGAGHPPSVPGIIIENMEISFVSRFSILTQWCVVSPH